MPQVAGLVIACATGMAVTAALIMISFSALSRSHEMALWMGQARESAEAVDHAADELLQLRSDARALWSGNDRAGQTQLPNGAADSSTLSRLETPLEDEITGTIRTLPVAAQQPARQLADLVREQRTALLQGVQTVTAGDAPGALALFSGALSQDRARLTREARDKVVAETGAVMADRIAKEARWRGSAFWLVLLGGGIGSLAVLGATVSAMLGLERRHALERMLARAQAALARSERTRHVFLQVVGHDLRQPLQAIGLFATGLERRLTHSDSLQLLEGMRSAASSMNRMLSGLMDVSRLDAGATAIEMASLRLEALLEPIRSEFSAIALSKGLEFEVPPCNLVVHTDPIMLESILRNLVSNAVRYTRRGRVDVSCTLDGDHAVVTVSDTGIGIPEADLDNIFQDFFTVAGNRSAEGLGLGLGLVRRMTELLGIAIKVTSGIGVGTRFTLPIPLSQSAPAEQTLMPAATVAEPPEVSLAGLRVLVVDDDEMLRRSLQDELRARGMLVTVAAEPAKVCEMFERSYGGNNHMLMQTDIAPAFDVVLVDRDLQSTMTGPELLDHLAARYGLALPALVLSGTTDFRVIQELQESGYPWLAKPVPMPVLLREMQRRTSQVA